jgi:transposase InsO family protein
LMKAAGITGIRPRKRFKTTIRIPGITPAIDLVERQFRPTLRTRCGSLTSPTCGPARAGCTSPRCRTRTRGRSSGGRWRGTCGHAGRRRAQDGSRSPAPTAHGLIHHSDHGSQYVSLAFGRAAGDAGIGSRWAPAETPTTTPSPRRSDG